MAQDVTIRLKDAEIAAIQKLANNAGIAPKEYAHNIITNFLKDRLMSYYKSEFDKKTISELADLFGSPI